MFLCRQVTSFHLIENTPLLVQTLAGIFLPPPPSSPPFMLNLHISITSELYLKSCCFFPDFLPSRKQKAVKPLAVNPLNNFKDRGTSITAPSRLVLRFQASLRVDKIPFLSRVQSSNHLDRDQCSPLVVETARHVSSQTESR